MGNTQELVTIIPWTFIAQILNLFIQMYLIKRFLFKPINDVLEREEIWRIRRSGKPEKRRKKQTA